MSDIVTSNAAKPDSAVIDEKTGKQTTGHEWDGIRELNNPLPRWWLWTLYLTIIFAIGYMVVYPAIPGLTTNTKGIWGWGSRADLRNQMTAVEQGRQAMNDKIAAMDINAIMADPEARTYAISAGASLFKVNCVQCHGANAGGSLLAPDLWADPLGPLVKAVPAMVLPLVALPPRRAPISQ